MQWMQNTTFSLGYIIVTRRSKAKENGVVCYVTLICDRGGEFKFKESSKKSGTQKTNCKFRLVGSFLKQYDGWTLRVICDQHNHPPAQHIEGHAYASRLKENEKKLLVDLRSKNDENNISTLKTIYNAWQKLRSSQNVSKTLIQFSVNNISNELENLFFIHPRSLDIWRAFPHVLIVDATYKTNKYDLPFVQIVGVTSINKTFSIAFTFIINEKEENYNWALTCLKLTLEECMYPHVIVTNRELALMNACQQVFPDATRLLCRWHITENIKKHCRQSIKSQHEWDSFRAIWTVLVESLMWILYTENYRKLQSMLSEYIIKKFIPFNLVILDIFIKLPPEVLLLFNSVLKPKTCKLAMIAGYSYIFSSSSCPFHFLNVYNTLVSVLKYLDQVWLSKYKDMFVSVWIDRHLNFGERTTNRVESQHAKLKKYLCAKNSSLDKFVGCIDQIVMSQLTPIYENFEKSRIVLKHRHNLPCFRLLRGFLNKEPARHRAIREVSDFIDLNQMPESCDTHPLMKEIPDMFHPYITHVQDVRGDGNCEFRAISVCLDELLSSYDVYARVFIDGIDELRVLIANRFGVILNYLTKRGDITFFPLWRGPEHFQYHHAITIAHVYDNHNVMVQLEGDYPMPTISAYWIRHRALSTAGWQTMYMSLWNFIDN
ncbi:hypothetical protein ES332_A09G172000v1 [Gossypium tomentosum]|uniref:MULE transposase domain-containing protein n=1 Tax=Gossypium tomentosum TaxID=34277 RepID=A0A5D2P4W5_GOSTO|nr:hypothetical protein ES332_A09G172000v1 [Gossypium tomentosum]